MPAIVRPDVVDNWIRIDGPANVPGTVEIPRRMIYDRDPSDVRFVVQIFDVNGNLISQQFGKPLAILDGFLGYSLPPIGIHRVEEGEHLLMGITDRLERS